MCRRENENKINRKQKNFKEEGVREGDWNGDNFRCEDLGSLVARKKAGANGEMKR